MGIPGFNTWFRQKYPQAFQNADAQPYDHVYVDMPSFLHETMRNAKNRKHFHALLHKRLDELFNGVKPRKTVVLALDGPAPLAKLITQRIRRSSTARSEAAKHSRASKRMRGVDSQETGEAALSALSLTPGSPVLQEIQTSLEWYICSRLTTQPKFRRVCFELSGATVQGEGEVKILNRLANNWQPCKPEDSHVILGNDSDLLLMAMTSKARNVYVLLDQRRKGAGMLRMSVAALEQVWGATYGSNLAVPEVQRKIRSLKLDLTALAFMCSGNDYLPALKGYRLDSIWQRYTKMRAQEPWARRCIVVEDEHGGVGFDHGFLRAVLAMGPVRDQSQPGSSSIDAEEVSLDGELHEEADGSHVHSQRPNDYSAASPIPPHPKFLSPNEVSERYLMGVLWTLQMYVSGRCPQYRWLFLGAAPLPWDLISFVETQRDREERGSAPLIDYTRFNADQPLIPAVHALALLPSSALHFAPSALRHLMGSSSPLADIYEQCTTCDSFRMQLKAMTQDILLAAQQMDSTLERLQVLVEQPDLQLTADPAELTEAGVLTDEEAALESEVEDEERLRRRYHLWQMRRIRLRRSFTMLSKAYDAHRFHKHSEAFPVARLEEAVAKELDSFPAEEHALTTFGCNHVYRYFPHPLEERHYHRWSAPRENTNGAGAESTSATNLTEPLEQSTGESTSLVPEAVPPRTPALSDRPVRTQPRRMHVPRSLAFDPPVIPFEGWSVLPSPMPVARHTVLHELQQAKLHPPFPSFGPQRATRHHDSRLPARPKPHGASMPPVAGQVVPKAALHTMASGARRVGGASWVWPGGQALGARWASSRLLPRRSGMALTMGTAAWILLRVG